MFIVANTNIYKKHEEKLNDRKFHVDSLKEIGRKIKMEKHKRRLLRQQNMKNISFYRKEHQMKAKSGII